MKLYIAALHWSVIYKFMFQNSDASGALQFHLQAGAQNYLAKIRKYLTLTNKMRSLEQVGQC